MSVRGQVLIAGATSFTVANNGTFAFTYLSARCSGRHRRGTAKDRNTKVITSVNEGLLSGRTLGTVKEIGYEPSKDKRKIQGWILENPRSD
jgi:hypothetical protein